MTAEELMLKIYELIERGTISPGAEVRMVCQTMITTIHHYEDSPDEETEDYVEYTKEVIGVLEDSYHSINCLKLEAE